MKLIKKLSCFILGHDMVRSSYYVYECWCCEKSVTMVPQYKEPVDFFKETEKLYNSLEKR